MIGTIIPYEPALTGVALEVDGKIHIVTRTLSRTSHAPYEPSTLTAKLAEHNFVSFSNKTLVLSLVGKNVAIQKDKTHLIGHVTDGGRDYEFEINNTPELEGALECWMKEAEAYRGIKTMKEYIARWIELNPDRV